MNSNLDVIVIGGGAQGLFTLRQLAARGYQCLLVDRQQLGAGQTLASHGWLHTGYVFPTAQLATSLHRIAEEKWQPFLTAHPEVLRADAKVFAAASTLQFESEYLPTWNAVGMAYQIQALDSLPFWMRGGTLDSADVQVAKVQDRILNKKALVHALTEEVEDLVFLGEVSRLKAAKDGRVISVEIANIDKIHSVTFQPKYVVVCAGVGTLALLQRIQSETDQDALLKEAKTLGICRAIHMICIRGKDDLLPDISIFEATPYGHQIVASHRDIEHGTVLWYITSTDSDAAAYLSTREPLTYEVSAPVQAKFVYQAVQQLLAKYPVLATIANQLEWGVYVEYKLDHGSGHPLSPCVETLRFAPNVCVCNPGLLSNHFIVAEETLNRVEAFIGDPKGVRATRPAGFKIPGIGVPNHDRATMTWLSWNQFQKDYKL